MSTANMDALVSSRICHDLISPVGAIGNGVELLAELAKSMPEIGLISDSVESAKAKLQYFRVCFGQNGAGAILGARDVQATADAMLTTNRLSLGWQGLAETTPREQVKLLYLALLCMEVALPLGGVLNIAQTEEGWALHAQSPRLQRDDIWDVLDWIMPPEPVTPARVQFLLLRDLGRDLGRTVAVTFKEDTLEITL